MQAFYNGNVPQEIGCYENSFGTYDKPGVFFISALNKPVIGIEFRIDDKRISYPEKLKSCGLGESFFYSIEIENEFEINLDSVHKLFEGIAKDDDAHRLYSDLIIKQQSDVISVFSSESGKKIRILYEGKISRSRTKYIIKDDFEKFEKNTLYHAAFFDPITNHNNWNHLVPFLEIPTDAGIQDYAFVHFDVKGFRVINEVYGHIAANKVLTNIVKAMDEIDFVYASARCHNDNFAMMIKDMPEEETIAKLEKFFENLSYLEEDPNYKIYYRCGFVPMKLAMLAGNRVADAGKMAQSMGNSLDKTDIVIYTDKMHEDILWGNYIKAYIDTAIKNDEFVVYLQPKFDIQTEKIKGAEALIRWNYKNKEFLSPARFIPFFEKDGNIGKIDDIILEFDYKTLLDSILHDLSGDDLEKLHKNIKNSIGNKSNRIKEILAISNQKNNINELAKGVDGLLKKVRDYTYESCAKWMKDYNLYHALKVATDLDRYFDDQYRDLLNTIAVDAMDIDWFVKLKMQGDKKRRDICATLFSVYIKYLVYRNLSNEDNGYLDNCKKKINAVIDAIDFNQLKIEGVKVCELRS
ncbi:MAG: EAL domain-containing protein, partial [Spirochaetaceae bacterium]|nr:EAL domain-containing protein [Spirochaetaceae bacterium]